MGAKGTSQTDHRVPHSLLGTKWKEGFRLRLDEKTRIECLLFSSLLQRLEVPLCIGPILVLLRYKRDYIPTRKSFAKQRVTVGVVRRPGLGFAQDALR